MAYANDRCYAIDTLWRNHVDNELIEGFILHTLEANVAHLTKKRSDLLDDAPYVSSAGAQYFEKMYGDMADDVHEEVCIFWKTTGTPSHYKNVPVKKLHPKNEKYEGRSY